MSISNTNDKKFYIANLAEIIPKKDIIINDSKQVKLNKIDNNNNNKEKSFTNDWENFIKFESCWSM